MKFVKFITVLAFVASAASLTGNWFLFQQLRSEQGARAEIESQQLQLEERNNFLESEAARVAQYQGELERLRSQLKGLVSQRDTIKKELDGAYGQISALKKQIQNLESEKQALTSQLNVGQATEDAIVREASRIATLPAPPLVVVETKPSAEQEKESKETKEPKKETKAAKGKEAAQKAKVAKAEPIPAKLAGDQRPLQVLSVNRQFKFVVVNVGIRGNLKVGAVLRVEQGGKLIGRVQVEKLYENFSACNIIEESKTNQIKEGDLVRLA